MKILTALQIKELDQYTIRHEPVSSIDLMERAAMQFTQALKTEIPIKQRIIVLSGPGNNGGDALAIARLLLTDHYHVETYLFNPQKKLTVDCETNKRRLLLLPDILFFEVHDSFIPPIIEENDVVIDGLFGSGLNRPLDGGFASVVQYINRSKARIFSIDIPSGLFGEDNAHNTQKTIVCADKTFTFQSPKFAFLMAENARFIGEWEVLDIGLHPDGIKETPTSYFYTEKTSIFPLWTSRPRFSHKGVFGHALLIAGSYGKLGAAVLAAKACMRSGAGILTAYIPECGFPVVQNAFPEALVLTDRQAHHISEIPDTSLFDAVAIGPGLGLHSDTSSALQELLRQCRKPLVVDADALNLMAQNKSFLELLPKGSILTPHPKELDRLTGDSFSSFERLQKALNLAVATQSYVILKGAYTAVCTPERSCHFNPTGNPGMATAGSGDVLTGMLLGLLAQGYQPMDAALIGVYLHGLAGDLATSSGSQESVIASDIIKKIGAAFRLLTTK